MGGTPCCEKVGLKKGPWTPEEDRKLVDYIQKHGYGNWRTLPKNSGLQRCGKSCRLRWANYLRPDIKRGRFSFEEEEAIIQLHSILGNKWSAIAARLPGRTDNEIKNYWNTHIRKKLLRMGIDPVTHNPRLDLLDLSTIFTNNNINTPMYNPLTSQQINMSRLLGLHPLVNQDLLKLASSLIPTNKHHDLNNNNPQMQNDFNPILQTTQIQTPTQNHATNSTTNPSLPYLGESQLVEPHFEHYPMTNFASFDGHNNFDQLQNQGFSSEGLVNIDQPTEFSCYYGSDQTFMDPISLDQSIMKFGPSSIMSSTPSSSSTPLNSNSNNSTTYVYSSGTEDERESYCSDMIKFEMPTDILDVNQFMLSQTKCS